MTRQLDKHLFLKSVGPSVLPNEAQEELLMQQREKP